jgi:hypothetical protein
MSGEPVSREGRKPFTQTINRCRWPQRAQPRAPKSPFDAALPLVRHDFHGDWNYTLLPGNTPSR